MFLICGEALFDMFAPGGNALPIPFEAHIGGSPFNVAVGLARLGEDTAFFGGISTDVLGERLMLKFEEEGVRPEHVHRSGHLTTLSVVQRDSSGQPAYTFYGENAADRMVTEADLPVFATPPAFIHVGSFSALVEPIAGTLKTLLRREKAHSLVSFDPNIRPTVVADMALWRTNTETLAALADVIKVSDEDLDLICPGVSHEAVARDWISRGAALVIVTRGGNGAVAHSATATWDIPGISVEVADTVGAGDTFQAALLSGLKALGVTDRNSLEDLDQKSVQRLLQFAVKASSITCTRRGADLPRRTDLENEIGQLQIGG